MHIEAGKNRAVPETEYKKEAAKGSARVIGFLMEFNYGDGSMTVRDTVDNLIYITENQEGQAKGKGPTDPQEILPELAKVINEEGFGPVQSWESIKDALEKVVADWDNHDSEWQVGVSKYFEGYRF